MELSVSMIYHAFRLCVLVKDYSKID